MNKLPTNLPTETMFPLLDKKINEDLYNYKINLAAAVAVISNFFKLDKLNKDIFKDFPFLDELDRQE